MPLRELQELVNPALLDASGLTLSSVMGSPGSGFEGTESSSIPRMSVDGLRSAGAGPRGCDDALRQLCEKKMNGTFNSDDFYGPSCKVGDDKRDLCGRGQ